MVKETTKGERPLRSTIGDDGSSPVSVAIVEDEGLFRSLLQVTLSTIGSYRIVGSFADARRALRDIPRLKPDVALLDIELGSGMSGIELGVALRRQMTQLGIVLLSNHCEPEFLAGVPVETVAGWSYLLKKSVEHVDTLARAIRGARDGLVVLDPQLITSIRTQENGPLSGLTPRQRQVLELMANGLTNGAIAERLSLSEKTIQNQINLIYDKLAIDRNDPAIQPRVKAVLTYLLRD